MTIEFDAIGTHWKIDLDNNASAAQREALLHDIQARVEIFDRDYSRFREDSLVTKMSHEAGTYQLPDDAVPMMRLYENAYRISKGEVTPLIGQVLVDAGYDATYSLVTKEMHQPPAWDEVMEYNAAKNVLVLKKPALLDFGAIGKGYLVDIVGDIVARHGFESYCVDAGGDLLQRSASGESLRVGLEHPQDFSKVIGVVRLPSGQSLCGSAGNRRAWGNFHHIINPNTLESPRHLQAVWTTAETTRLADAMSTCLFFVPPEKLLKYHAFEYLMMFPDSSVKKSKGFRAELFT